MDNSYLTESLEYLGREFISFRRQNFFDKLNARCCSLWQAVNAAWWSDGYSRSLTLTAKDLMPSAGMGYSALRTAMDKLTGAKRLKVKKSGNGVMSCFINPFSDNTPRSQQELAADGEPTEEDKPDFREVSEFDAFRRSLVETAAPAAAAIRIGMEIVAFWGWNAQAKLDYRCIALWQALLYIYQGNNCQKEIVCTDSVLAAEARLGKTAFKAAREILVKAGKIKLEYKKLGGKDSLVPTYTLTLSRKQYERLTKNGQQNLPQNRPQITPKNTPENTPENTPKNTPKNRPENEAVPSRARVRAVNNNNYIYKNNINKDNNYTNVVVVKDFEVVVSELKSCFSNGFGVEMSRAVCNRVKEALDFGMSPETIRMTIDLCAKLGRADIPYFMTVLNQKQNDNVRSTEDFIQNEKERAEARKKANGMAAAPRKKSGFANYNGREWDYDELERLAAEYVEKTCRY